MPLELFSPLGIQQEGVIVALIAGGLFGILLDASITPGRERQTAYLLVALSLFWYLPQAAQRFVLHKADRPGYGAQTLGQFFVYGTFVAAAPGCMIGIRFIEARRKKE